MPYLPLLLLCLTISAAPALGHESWLQPHAYRVAPGEAILADIRVGENFKGQALSYLPAQVRQLRLYSGALETDLSPRMGDKPALNTTAPEGLAVLLHESAANLLTYTDFAKFENFSRHKDFSQALAHHRARGLPETGFSERYFRHVKSLVAVGHGRGADRVLGLEIELQALANPYTAARSSMPLQLLQRGAPRPYAQIELFELAPDGSVAISLHRTDARGQVTIPVRPGHAYLVDSVLLRDTGNDDPRAGPVWESHWAALTFAIPPKQ